MKLFIYLHMLLVLSGGLFARTIDPNRYYQYYRQTRNEPSTVQPIYLLVTTSSKIYSIKLSGNFNYNSVESERFKTENDVIYREDDLSNNWITDAFYVKSEGLIYVNVYNSSSSSSNIFTLKYDQESNRYLKNVLYRDQRFCLGITYNEAKKELYWTTSKSIIAGTSNPDGKYKVIYELNRAKKLLYLKYDNAADKLYVSTLNYVYECGLGNQDFTQSIIYTERCRIIARNLVSARGLYLDNINRFLYIVDHKKRIINRIKLKPGLVKKNLDNQMGSDESYQMTQIESVKANSFISQETMPDLGDVFNMIIYNRSEADLLIWTEFSGKIKIARMSDRSEYKVLFNTNEYTYSISLMDNSTEQMVHETTTKSSTTTTTKIEATSDQDYSSQGLPKGWRYVKKETTPALPTYDYVVDEDEEEEESVISLATKSLNDYGDGDVIAVGSRKFIVEGTGESDKLITAQDFKRPRTNKLAFLKSSSHLNAALYIVICLLCFSLFINIILLYISKIKHNKSKQLIISHEICDIQGMPKRCGSAATKSTSEDSCTSGSNECNLNLINSTGNSTNGLDSDH